MSFNIIESINLLTKSIPLEVLTKIKNYKGWIDFFNREVIQFLEKKHEQKKSTELSMKHIPTVKSLPKNGIIVNIWHQFSENEMNIFGDDLIKFIKEKIRKNPNHDHFEGEEVLACWLERGGKKLPSKLPDIGSFSEGGYVMYMNSNAKQKPHQHGLKIGENSYLEGSGVRFLVGLIGSNYSTIRHSEGIIKLSRGQLISILFKQEDIEPSAAHQFWNEGEGIGNVFLSFHQKDFKANDQKTNSIDIGSRMVNLRTYHFDNSVYSELSNHGFKI